LIVTVIIRLFRLLDPLSRKQVFEFFYADESSEFSRHVNATTLVLNRDAFAEQVNSI
jgi:hypothetical protein